MNAFVKYISLITISSFIVLSSCKKDPADDTPNDENLGALKIEFENRVADSALVLNTGSYVNANGDTFSVSKFKYYITNIKLMTATGTYAEPESYHLVDQSVSGSLGFTINNVPQGNYTGISFMVCVDSTRNVSGSQTGALDPANGMFWSWMSGYIMAKFEGTSPQSGDTTGRLLFHVGGFSGANNVLKTVTPSFGGATANVTETTTPEVHIVANLAEWFNASTSVDFATLYTIHGPGANAKMLADNYADMFMVHHIHN